MRDCYSLIVFVGVTVMCHVGSMTVMYIGLGTIQLSPYISDGICVGLGTTIQ